MTNASKTKGRAFEYVVRDKMTDTFKSQFERVPLSGALSYLKGDVYAPWLPDFPWTIEAKHHKEVDWNNVLTAKTSLLLEFWDQTTREAMVMKKHPLLIYKWDRSKLYACWFDDKVKTRNFVHIKSGTREFYMTLLDDWLNEASQVYTKPN
jgi:hypothetical protein